MFRLRKLLGDVKLLSVRSTVLNNWIPGFSRTSIDFQEFSRILKDHRNLINNNYNNYNYFNYNNYNNYINYNNYNNYIIVESRQVSHTVFDTLVHNLLLHVHQFCQTFSDVPVITLPDIPDLDRCRPAERYCRMGPERRKGGGPQRQTKFGSNFILMRLILFIDFSKLF